MASPSSRLIRLRRPAILHLADAPFVPEVDGGVMDEVDRRWSALCASNPAFFDGRMVHVLGVHRNGCGGATIHLADCAYRFHAVQDDDFDLGVRPLGVKGLTRLAGDDHDGDAGRVLLGLRSAHVAQYRHLWEFAPGGVVEPNRDAGSVLVTELHEETGLRPATDPVPVAIVYDDTIHTWELVYDMRVTQRTAEPPTSEYAELRWCAPDDLPADLTPLARRLIPLL